MSTWQERLKVAVGPRGYDGSMRRSVQTVLLYEALRCIESTHQKLRPFQRKLAHIDQMMGTSVVNMYPSFSVFIFNLCLTFVDNLSSSSLTSS